LADCLPRVPASSYVTERSCLWMAGGPVSTVVSSRLCKVLMSAKDETAVVRAVDAIAGEMIDFLQGLTRIPTVNPPGKEYTAGAEFIGARLKDFGYDVQYVTASERPEHTREHPRINVVGHSKGSRRLPCCTLTVTSTWCRWRGLDRDPFAALLRDGKLYGRGTATRSRNCSVHLCHRSHSPEWRELAGTVEQSGTVDEESGGFAVWHVLPGAA